MPIPLCNLRVHRPTPTTVEYTVSTRAPRQTLTAHLLHHVTVTGKLLIAFCALLLLWTKAGLINPALGRISIPWMISESLLGQSCLVTAHATPSLYLFPIALGVVWICARRGYTEESLLVLRGLGLQTTSSSGTYLSTSYTRFIPTTSIQDVFIHEAFKGFEVRFYLAIVVESEQDVVVVFPNLLPSLAILEEVWRGARSCLYEPKP